MREFWVATGLLWLAGVGLRLSILAVPPVILPIQADLRLSGTEVGVLSGLPMVMFAIAALPGSLFIARLGAMPTLVIGFLIAGVASALRGAILDAFALYAATIVMSAGIAITQPTLPPLVRQWLPQRVSFGAAVFTHWPAVTPWVLEQADQFRSPTYPSLSSPAYADALNEVRSLGLDASTSRSGSIC